MPIDPADPFDLARFVAAQQDTYASALAELQAGRKRSHWIWFVLPQLRGLGLSGKSQRYGIASLDEARAYLAHPVLGPRLHECTATLNALGARAAADVLGELDALKWRSNLTLFAAAAGRGSIFEAALARYFGGQGDARTLELLSEQNDGQMPTETSDPEMLDGGCTCRHVRYRLASMPLFVHCCHCRWCQRESGAAFALNALIESDRVHLLDGEVDTVATPSQSGKGQVIARCPRCRVALWSHYAGLGDALSFVRVGTLDHPDRLPPDIHIYTASKQPWVLLPPHQAAVAEYYRAADHWPPSSLQRRAAMAAKARRSSS